MVDKLDMGILLCIVTVIFIAMSANYLSKRTEISPEVQEVFQKIPEVSEDPQTPQNLKEAKEDPKETPQTNLGRPLKFRKFIVVVEIYSKEPKDDNCVREETKKLMDLAKSVADVNDVKIIKLQGVSVSRNQTFDISLD